MFQVIKTYIITLLAAVSGVLGLLFLYEKNKARVDEALVKNSKTKEEVAQQDTKIAQTNASLEAEESKRKELENEAAKNNPDVIAISKYFNKP